MEKTLKTKDISNNIKAERQRAGFTQAEIAEVLNVTRTTYGSMERNPENVKYKTLEKLAEAFGCTVTDFFVL